MPAACPVCGQPVVRDEGAVRHYCANPQCPARVGQEYGHFAAAMDIDGLGWAVLTQLLERGMVKRRGTSSASRSRTWSPSTGSRGRAPRTSMRRSRRHASGAGTDHRRPRHPAGRLDDGDRAEPLAGGRGARPATAGSRDAGAYLRDVAGDSPERFEEIEASVRSSPARWPRGSRPAARARGSSRTSRTPASRRSCRLPAPPPRPGRWPASRSSSRARSRASAARRPRRRSAPPAASPWARSRRRPTTSSPVRRRLEAHEGPGARRSRPRRRRIPERLLEDRVGMDEPHAHQTGDAPRLPDPARELRGPSWRPGAPACSRFAAGSASRCLPGRCRKSRGSSGCSGIRDQAPSRKQTRPTTSRRNVQPSSPTRPSGSSRSATRP